MEATAQRIRGSIARETRKRWSVARRVRELDTISVAGLGAGHNRSELH